jgi:hypothetical protein
VASKRVVVAFISAGIESWSADAVIKKMRRAALLDHYQQLVKWRELAEDLPQDRDLSTAPVELATWDVGVGLFEPAMTIPDDPLPSMLLRAEYGVVPFVGRQTEQDLLTEWLTAAAPVSALLVTGPGGEGKTRLAGELIAHAPEDQWVAGFLAEAVPTEVLATLRHLPGPLLLVVDYADGPHGPTPRDRCRPRRPARRSAACAASSAGQVGRPVAVTAAGTRRPRGQTVRRHARTPPPSVDR